MSTGYLIITITHWNLVLEYNGTHGIGTAHYNHAVFNSQFNAGMRSGGSHTAVSAILDLLHLAKRTSHLAPTKEWPMPGTQLIEDIVFSPEPWKKIEFNMSSCLQACVPLTEEMIATFPFLQQRVDLFWWVNILLPITWKASVICRVPFSYLLDDAVRFSPYETSSGTILQYLRFSFIHRAILLCNYFNRS